MPPTSAVVTAAVFLWPGMVLAISCVEAPLKFRASNVTLAIGLDIGRPVFQALIVVESLLAAVVLATIVADPPGPRAAVALVVAIAVSIVQMVLVRPRPARRSNAVLAGHDAPRSHSHYAYIGLEILKVAALPTGGIFLLTGALP